MSRFTSLVWKEFTIEIRQKQSILGILLFCLILVFLLYKTLNRLEGLPWAVLIWVILLFVGVNAIVKSFTQEHQNTRIFYYTLYNPTTLIIAKMTYNFLILCLLFTLIFTFFSFFFGNFIKDWSLFIKAALLGNLGLSVLFSFIAAVSTSSDDNNALMMSILALPLTLPILLLVIRCTAVAMRLITDTAIVEDLWMLVAIDTLFIGLVILLFDELWMS